MSNEEIALARFIQPGNRKAEKDGQLQTVFCGSLCDVMEENTDIATQRHRLFGLIPQTPFLIWLLLTKRPQNFRRFMPAEWLNYNEREMPWNICAMTTVGVQKSLWRADELVKVPTRWRAISYEPALEWVSFAPYYPHHWRCSGCGYRTNAKIGDTCKGYCQDPTGKSCNGIPCPQCGRYHYWSASMASIDWVICGGESGSQARPFSEEWGRRTIKEAQGNPAGRVPVFMKQYGANPHRPLSTNAALEMEVFAGTPLDRLYQIKLKHPKGEDPVEWPRDLQVQESPDWLSGVPWGHPLYVPGLARARVMNARPA